MVGNVISRRRRAVSESRAVSEKNGDGNGVAEWMKIAQEKKEGRSAKAKVERAKSVQDVRITKCFYAKKRGFFCELEALNLTTHFSIYS